MTTDEERAGETASTGDVDEPDAPESPVDGAEAGPESADDADVPAWDDEYVDRVSDRIMFNYDLEKDVTVRGEPFTLRGELRMESHKQFFHPAITYGHQHAYEHLFLTERGPVRVSDIDRFVDLGHTLADEWVDADEEHYATDFTFVAVADAISDDVRDRVASFEERTLLRYGYNGHYEIHLAVVAPEDEDLVVSRNADVVDAIRTWEPIESDAGFVSRLKQRLFG
ncbi:hypothetical protein C2R22_20305 [Salinigranum rubrum]|uniref:DUF8052 domain-containing protein n=1 Tax=Salinigranum rubrum TaxID=755307 RepID=A0A2I8VR91_9EURY|nr:hypothetical protein [Salinigranum rubrum]AUV83699.1 hypothetical protein C2R22_20305 [Salinigranum rubrum]